MTGMKEGAGEDPFAEEDESGPQRESISERGGVGESSEETEGSDVQSESTTAEMDIPYKFRREGVMDGRSQMPVYLREEIQNQEPKFIRELEDLLGEEVPKADAREAAFIAAYRSPERVAGVLREWGFDYEGTG